MIAVTMPHEQQPLIECAREPAWTRMVWCAVYFPMVDGSCASRGLSLFHLVRTDSSGIATILPSSSLKRRDKAISRSGTYSVSERRLVLDAPDASREERAEYDAWMKIAKYLTANPWPHGGIVALGQIVGSDHPYTQMVKRMIFDGLIVTSPTGQRSLHELCRIHE